MHALKILVFDPPVDRPYSFELAFKTLATAAAVLPPLRWRVLPNPLALNHPLCVIDPAYDPAKHIFRAELAPPADEAALLQCIADLSDAPLRRDRPLWEAWLVEGYRQHQMVAVMKIHHALMDGVGTESLFYHLFSTQLGGKPRTLPLDAPERALKQRNLLRQGFKDLLGGTRKLPRKLRAIRDDHRRLRNRGLPAALLPPKFFVAPATHLNRTIGARRRLAFVTCSFANIRSISRAHGVTINDVVLCIVGEAVRSYLDSHGELPEAPLIGMVPYSVRDREADVSFGNQSRMMPVSLCTNIVDPAERLLQIHARMNVAKQVMMDTRDSRPGVLISQMPPFIGRQLIGIPMRRAARNGSPMANVTVSNVPGPRDPLFLGTMPLREIYSCGPVVHGMGLNVTFWTYLDTGSFCLQACSTALNDLSALTAPMLHAIERLEQKNVAPDRG